MIQSWQITPAGHVLLPVSGASLDDLTRQLPAGYYSTFRTFAGGRRVLGLTAHLERLYGPVSTPDVGEAFLRRQLSGLLDAYRPGEARVRAVMTAEGEVYLALTPLVPYPREVYENGVRVETTGLQRESPTLKSTGFIGKSDTTRRQLAAEGIFEALLVQDGKILEGMTSNFFYIRKGEDGSPRAGTAADGVLPGITRQTVLEILQGKGLAVSFEALLLNQVASIDEAFITSSSRGIVPVVRVDRTTVGQGSPGPITRDLMAAYDPYVIEKAEEI